MVYLAYGIQGLTAIVGSEVDVLLVAATLVAFLVPLAAVAAVRLLKLRTA